MKLISWNVNGIRAAIKKDFAGSLAAINPDVICLQETKAQPDQVIEALAGVEGYHIYANSAVKKGYSSTAILSREKPLEVENDMGVEEHDQEGRVIRASYPNFHLVTVYTPNSKSDLSRLDYRERWDADFKAYLQELEKTKPVLVCGDLNVAHKEIDLARPKANYNKSAGFTQREINGLNAYVDAGFVDTFRNLQPEEVKYTWWSYRAGARQRNVGWRIDYFLASKSIASKVSKSFILNEIHGSDHCPVGVELSM